jgi:LIM domain-containing protein/protein DA1
MVLSQPVCKGCGQPIWGNYFSALGGTWHPEHFVCAACGRPIVDASFNLHQGAPMHVTCYANQVAPRCAYCGKPLLAEYYVDSWGTAYCKEHQREYAHCVYCGRLVPPGQEERPSSSSEAVRCSICRASAIETAAEAKPLFTHVKDWVGSQGLVYNSLPLSLELCDRARLMTLLRGRSQVHSLGATVSSTYTQNGRVVRTEIGGVAVLRGLPATLFQGVTVHELGHVWLVVHGIASLPAWSEEGFCELLSHRLYTQMDTPESRHRALAIEQNGDPIYGAGFQRVRARADALGFARLLDGLCTTKALP